MARAVASRSHWSAHTASLHATSAALRASMSSASSVASPAALSRRASIDTSRAPISVARCSKAALATGSAIRAPAPSGPRSARATDCTAAADSPQAARVPVRTRPGQSGERGVEIAQERRQVGRRAVRGAPYDGDNSAHRGTSVEARRPRLRPIRDGPGSPRYSAFDARPARGRRPTRPRLRSGASTMTRTTGSVPELRTTTRPRSPNSASTCRAAVPYRRHARGRRRERGARSRAPAAGASCRRPTPRPTCRCRASEIADDQAGEHAVAGRREIGEHDVTRLLAADREVVRRHRRDHVPVTDRRLDDVDTGPANARRSPRFDMTVTAIASLRKHPASVPVERGHDHDLVAVDEVAVLVDRDHAVGVTVEREAEVGAAFYDRALQERRIGRSAVGIDVATVGLRVASRRPARRPPGAPAARARTPRRSRSRARRGARRAFGPRAAPRRCVDVGLEVGGIGGSRRRAHGGGGASASTPGRGPGRSASASIADSISARQLATVGIEQLHAVVAPRVVARRHDRRRQAGPLREERDRRSGRDTERPDAHSLFGQAPA